ncbi:7-carboxy-7-deazaguanine synthase QueE [Prosthecobacter vanneervenii]|uniref:7-carboxy-7-deazaguanine synthase n=1 Tax=Prosthecobacter vanneervenii TaxID=48466 RepID=A0A7W7Y7J1_9BACT|nr:7-carboxy-7-deazaguanine synthase QueE [Prosthecobacter vanneervenii]MBB5031046.1 7-carboxy-7-deazaguanine synthase [Prosthecobacter vanneervenii]
MLISETFYSVQGEGSLVGVPSVFVRTSGCNLRCTWCDTPYASWKPEGTEMSMQEIMAIVQREPTRFVVVTGGEPMVAKGMPELLARLRAAGKHITIETAGTIAPEGVACDLASISPKLAHSTPSEEKAGKAWAEKHERTRLQPEVLRAWCTAYDYQLKFVVATEADVAEVRAVVDSIGVPVPPEKVLLMPEGITQEALRARQTWLVDVCKRTGWRYSPRLHIDLFGNKRGT